jgi:16S rRNA processing protein RimM
LENKDHVLIGIVVGAHSVKGTCKIRSFAESLSLFTPGIELLVRSKSSGTDKSLEINWVKPHTGAVLISFRGISNRTQAEALIGSELYVPKEMLPDLDADTHYWLDLIGMAVFTIDRTYLGRIKSIIETGSNDVYVVNDGQNEVLVPALGSVVVNIDTKRNRMDVDLPEGLI